MNPGGVGASFSGAVTQQLKEASEEALLSEKQGGKVGSHRGEEVRAPKSRLAMLASASEEMSFLKAEKRTRSLKETKVKDRTKSAQSKKILRKMMAKLKEPKEQEKLDKMMARMMLLDDASEEDLRDLLEQTFDDISAQYMAGMYAAQELKRKKARKRGSSSSDALEQALDEVLDDMETNQGEEIRAGINVSDAARDYEAQGLGSANEYRSFYRDSVLDYGGLSNAYASIVKEKGAENFPASVRALKEGLSADLSSSGPSIPETKLQLIVDDMFQLTVLEDMHFQSFEMLRKAEDLYRQVFKQEGHLILQKILDAKDRHLLKPQMFLEVFSKLDVDYLQARIYIAQALLRMAREMPHKVFNSAKHRENLLGTIQSMVDGLIEQEEEEEDDEDD